jgi:hypothetical protein
VFSFSHLQKISNSSLSLSLSSQVSFLSLTNRRCWYTGKSRPLSDGEWPSPRQKARSFQVLYHSLSILRCLTLSLTSHLSCHRFCSTSAKSRPLAGAEETRLSPRRKTLKPDSIYSLAPSLFLLPHQLTLLPPIITCKAN